MAGESDPALLPPPSLAAIYVIRFSQLGGPVLGQVRVDGRFVASLGVNSFVVIHRPAGTYEITAIGDENRDEFRLTVEAGKYYFLRLDVGMGWVRPRFYLKPLGEGYAHRVFFALREVKPASE